MEALDRNVTDRWRAVEDEGASGIADATIGLERAEKNGVPVTIRLESVRMDDFMFGLTQTRHSLRLSPWQVTSHTRSS